MLLLWRLNILVAVESFVLLLPHASSAIGGSTLLCTGIELFGVWGWGFSFFPVGGNREGEGGKKSYTEEAF